MRNRMLAAYAAVILCFALLTVRISLLCTAEPLAAAQKQQSAAVLNVVQTRGVIYDRKLRPLTCIQNRNIAAVMPNDRSADAVMRATEPQRRQQLSEMLRNGRPFLWETESADIYANGVEMFKIPKRYISEQPALHIIGQLDPSTGKGASGLEKAYDEMLSAMGGILKVRYTTDALQRGITAAAPIVENSGYDSREGIVLTIDRDIQLIAENAIKSLEKGAVVVMEPYTGDILACASYPVFDPLSPADSMNSDDQPFFNRAFAAYSVGSTFKLLTACCALESGIDIDHSYNCEGAIEVKDQVFHCHNLAGHGEIQMTEALRRSCNPYFISLALETGGQTLLYKARQLGFATAFEAAPGFSTASGTLPTQNELIAPAAVANFGFGQGVLTATPVQVANLISAVANGGNAVEPRLVMGSTKDGEKMESRTVSYSARSVFLPSAAQKVKDMMIAVVEEGSGKNAMPKYGGAGGKTASAQSGQYVDGKETVHAWFSGFYPADKPRYTIVVLAEGGESGSDAACPVFAEIADGLWELEHR